MHGENSFCVFLQKWLHLGLWGQPQSGNWHCGNFQLCKQSVCTLTHSMFPHYIFQPPLLCWVLFSSLWLRVDYTSTYDVLDPKFLAFNNSSTCILSIGGSASLSNSCSDHYLPPFIRSLMLSQLLHSNIQLHLHLVTLKHTGGVGWSSCSYPLPHWLEH